MDITRPCNNGRLQYNFNQFQHSRGFIILLITSSPPQILPDLFDKTLDTLGHLKLIKVFSDLRWLGNRNIDWLFGKDSLEGISGSHIQCIRKHHKDIQICLLDGHCIKSDHLSIRHFTKKVHIKINIVQINILGMQFFCYHLKNRNDINPFNLFKMLQSNRSLPDLFYQIRLNRMKINQIFKQKITKRDSLRRPAFNQCRNSLFRNDIFVQHHLNKFDHLFSFSS